MKRRAAVLLVGRQTDPQLRAVAAALDALGAPHHTVDGHQLCVGGSLQISLGSGPPRVRWQGRVLARPAAVYLRSLPGVWPPVGHADDGQPVVLARWMVPYMQSREREAALGGLLQHWHAQGVPMLNPPAASRAVQNKPHQLMTATALGVPVPPTLLTNHPDAAERFARTHRKAIAKPVGGGAHTLMLHAPLSKAQRTAVAASPVLVQKQAPGQDVRLYLLAGRMVSCAALDLPDGPWTDFRQSPAYQLGNARYVSLSPPRSVVAHARRWARACNLVFAGMDLRLSSRGRWVFLEANASPIFMDQQEKTGDDIAGALAGWLAGQTRR